MTEQKEDPRFVSTSGRPELIALLSGHTASVTADPDGTPLHPRFHRAAMLLGVVPIALRESTIAAKLEEQTANQEASREQLILRAIGEMVKDSANDEKKRIELFTADGRPDVRALSTRVGFPINASERDANWAAFADEGDDE